MLEIKFNRRTSNDIVLLEPVSNLSDLNISATKTLVNSKKQGDTLRFSILQTMMSQYPITKFLQQCLTLKRLLSIMISYMLNLLKKTNIVKFKAKFRHNI